ncbi:hypothetical protein PXH59_00580 (plasmid) [Xenorhabdus sp. SF857]|uniref:hypothetical protein n=1 Tax=Xenorhabdus bakwenae TaxID=3026967 RepID=UPI0025583755|nr:hypothetical protein [Xenorhabdus sp. SF857]WFQ78174.1 hypothetical protein PXH59_00580 [Xenorhabdus sp. SF857]
MDKTTDIIREREVTHQFGKKIAIAILRGAKTADVAAINGLKYAACREILHKFCRNVNPKAYEQINIDAAIKDYHSPFLEQLRENKHEFISEPERRNPEQLRREIKVREERLNNAQITVRSERTILSQLEAELAAVIQKK